METNKVYPLTSAVLVPASALSRDRYPPSILVPCGSFPAHCRVCHGVSLTNYPLPGAGPFRMVQKEPRARVKQSTLQCAVAVGAIS